MVIYFEPSRAAGYQPPPQVRIGERPSDTEVNCEPSRHMACCLTNKQWRTCSDESSERGGGNRVTPAAAKYPHALRQLCDMASFSRHKSSNATAVECEQKVRSHRSIGDCELKLEWSLYVLGAVAG